MIDRLTRLDSNSINGRRQHRLLVVDDQPVDGRIVSNQVCALGYACLTAASGDEALDLLNQDIDLVLTDIIMPETDGLELARRIRCNPAFADIPIVVITALDSSDHRLAAMEAGVNDLIPKPVDPTVLQIRLSSLLKMKDAQDALKRNQAELELKVQIRTEALTEALQRVTLAEEQANSAHLDTIHRLAIAAEMRDGQTAAHIARVSNYSTMIARSLGIPEDECTTVFWATSVHDVGKIAISDTILRKPGPLSTIERRIMQSHALIGAHILEGSPSPLLQAGEVVARTHHEKWDGTGYPFGLSEEQIPREGRICAVADVFDALLSERSYKRAFSLDESIEIMREGRGKHFDPHILDVFLHHRPVIRQIVEQYGPQTDPSVDLVQAA